MKVKDLKGRLGEFDDEAVVDFTHKSAEYNSHVTYSVKDMNITHTVNKKSGKVTKWLEIDLARD